jgi:5-methylcytosine-specific restriction endonuclease McrA
MLVLAAGGDGAFIEEEVWLDFLRSIGNRLSKSKLKGGRGIIVCVRDGFKCHYCGKGTDLTFDHVIPKCRGGRSGYQNVVLACYTCNQLKEDLDVDEFLIRLKEGKVKAPYRVNHVPLSAKVAESLLAKGYALENLVPAQSTL